MADRAGAAMAMSYPGIDPRLWVIEATVDEVHVGEDGVFVDVTAHATEQPDGLPNRAQMVPAFAGAGFGIYVPVQAGDLVLVVAPDGNLDGSPRAFGPMHNDQDTLPQEAQDEPESLWVVAQKDKHIRFKVTGDGVVSFDAPRVELGPWESSNPLTCWNELKSILNSMKNLVVAHTHVVNVAGVQTGDSTVTATSAVPGNAASWNSVATDISNNKPASKYAKSRTQSEETGV